MLGIGGVWMLVLVQQAEEGE
uniref:Uncharacterized protein n=1 Tax=Rhizophora mucronata TaxID=61149 RepID=A0A2P2MPW4_RHIMU